VNTRSSDKSLAKENRLNKLSSIKIIDLFAGPGGLGEGFSSYKHTDGTFPFEIVASVEKEFSAHKTLQLRAFFRKFPSGEAPDEYYQYIRGEGITRDQLFEKYKAQSLAALKETLDMPRALGEDNQLIESRIKDALKKHDGPKVVIGGPPCQAYSLVGRSRNLGNAEYVPEDDQRHFLYKEYLKILKLVRPDVFVMENVKGILSSKLNGEYIFPQIICDLRNPAKALGAKRGTNYKIYSLVEKPEDFNHPDYPNTSSYIIRAEQFGVAQARHRVILLGVRADINSFPTFLKTTEKVNVDQVIGDLPKLRSGLSKELDTDENWTEVIKLIRSELTVILNNDREVELSDAINKADHVLSNLNRGSSFVKSSDNFLSSSLPTDLNFWLRDPKIGGVLNHEARGHIREDLKRYLFCAYYAQKNKGKENPSPKAKDFPKTLAPEHVNWESGKFSDRFRVQPKGKYATTITSHISKDGHYFIHYDPAQCRSLTVREAARIQTFPDNYFFEGNRTQQYVQVGNAVPPFLARQIAHIVFQLI
jgi:DNA (cytosine-5)-methyltransferase 1